MVRRIERALVLGGAGFLGGWVVRALREEAIAVTVVDRTTAPAVDSGVKTVAADVRELVPAELMRAERVDAVFHLAGSAHPQPSLDQPIEDLEANAITTLRVLEGARALEAPPIVAFASSAAVYGNSTRLPMDEGHPLEPVSPYGVSKLAAERYVRLYAAIHDVPAFSVRPFSLYGPGQRKQVVYDLLVRILEGEDPLTVLGSPEVSRDLVFARDAGRAFVALARGAEGRGEAYNVASGRETTLGELVQELLEVTGASPEVRFTGQVRPGDPLRWVGDPAAARRLGGGCDTSLSEGLRATAEWVAAVRSESAV